MGSLNLQRNSEVFFSTIDLANGAAPSAMTPVNTWKVEVLAGFAVTSSSATQDITSMESGTSPDRSQQRFNTSIEPVDWNFQTYMRPTGAVTPNAIPSVGTGISSLTGNSKPVADWFLWQALVSNTRVASTANTAERSVWGAGGRLNSNTTDSVNYVSATRSNFSTAQEYFLYFKLDNVIYQVSNAAVNQATVDAGIEEIATTTWAGMGTGLTELTSTTKTNAHAVFGAAGVAGNANATGAAATFAYHPYNQMNVAGTVSTNSFIKNRLSSISLTHNLSGSVSTYTFPVTALTFDYTNNMTYVTPEELSALNAPVGQFTGARAVTGSVNMYLRNDSNESAQFLRNISTDSRTNHAQFASANLQVGGTTGPLVAFNMPAVQFDFPQLSIDDVIGMSVSFMAQEPTATKGSGGEVSITAAKA